jgi:RNA polymerase sigma-70 factor (ECF subfamily)
MNEAISAVNREFFGERWLELRSELRAFLLSRVRDRTAVDDLLQEVFVKVWRQTRSLDSIVSLRSWVYRIAHNAVVDLYKRERPTVDLDTIPEAAVPDTDIDEIHTCIAKCLGRMIDELDPIYGQALRLFDIEKLSLKQAAETLGISITAVKSRIRRARSQLKEALLDCCEFEFSATGKVLDYRPRRKAACDAKSLGSQRPCP